jgi:hypothetical protein
LSIPESQSFSPMEHPSGKSTSKREKSKSAEALAPLKKEMSILADLLTLLRNYSTRKVLKF